MSTQRTAPRTDWHALSPEEVLAALDSAPSGLTEEEARRRLAVYGPNRVEAERAPSVVSIFLHQIQDPMIYVLFGAIGIALAVQETVDAAVIAAAVGLNTVVGFFQEYRAEKAVTALAELVAPRALVVRDARRLRVDAEALVPGDVVLLEAGYKVPADIRLIETVRLSVDESLLTGESVPVQKRTDPVPSEEGAPLGVSEIANVAFAGSVVTSGRGSGVVVATGSGTRLGQISREVASISRARTPLQAQLATFSKLLGAAAAVLACAMVAFGVAKGDGLVYMLRLAAALLVAAIPEGLPVVITVSLAVGVTRMARRRAVVRRLIAAETLGSVTAIVSDKTGTLTENKMTVRQVYAGGRLYHVEGAGYAPEGALREGEAVADPRPGSPLHMLLLAGALCSDAELVSRKRDKIRPERAGELEWSVTGDPTEGALVVAAAKAGVDWKAERIRFRRVSEIPFPPERSYMATLHELPDPFWEKHLGDPPENGGPPPLSLSREVSSGAGAYDSAEAAPDTEVNSRLLLVKGAPEKVVSSCRYELSADGTRVAVSAGRLLQQAEMLASEGLRVLGFACKLVGPDTSELSEEEALSDLCFLGFQGSLDPPRPEAMKAVEGARRSGITVYMATGDHEATARAVARMLGLVGEDDAPVLTGRDVAEMSPEALTEAVATVRVFARVEPEHKLLLVRALQECGEVVAVTGDGVNDAPALKQANIGIAMGRTGTDVAREAADVVLTDDNFATIYAAVLGGRAIYENLKKAVMFLIPTGFGLTITIVAGLVFGAPVPFRPAQIIWINLVTNSLQDLALAFEPPRRGIEDERPRDPGVAFFDWVMLRRTLFVGAYLAAGTYFVFHRADPGLGVEYAETLAVTTMVFFQNFYLFNSRAPYVSIFEIRFFSNRYLFASVLAALGAHLGAMYWEPLRSVMGFVPLSGGGWVTALAVGSSVLPAVEAAKWVWSVVGARRDAR